MTPIAFRRSRRPTPADARAQGEQDASTARATAEFDNRPPAQATLTPVARWVPVRLRTPYLDGAASVLGYRPTITAP